MLSFRHMRLVAELCAALSGTAALSLTSILPGLPLGTKLTEFKQPGTQPGMIGADEIVKAIGGGGGGE